MSVKTAVELSSLSATKENLWNEKHVAPVSFEVAVGIYSVSWVEMKKGYDTVFVGLTYNSVCRRTRAKQYSPEVVINESLNFRANSPSTAHALTFEVLGTRAAEKCSVVVGLTRIDCISYSACCRWFELRDQACKLIAKIELSVVNIFFSGNHGLWYDPEISLETNGMCFVHETV